MRKSWSDKSINKSHHKTLDGYFNQHIFRQINNNIESDIFCLNYINVSNLETCFLQNKNGVELILSILKYKSA